MTTTTEPAKVERIAIRDIRHECGPRVTHRTFFAALVMTDGTVRFCGDEQTPSRRHESHRTIAAAKACGIKCSQKIGYIPAGQQSEG